VYWYEVTRIGGRASVRTSLDELLRGWKLPVAPLTATQARRAAAASVVTAAARFRGLPVITTDSGLTCDLASSHPEIIEISPAFPVNTC